MKKNDFLIIALILFFSYLLCGLVGCGACTLPEVKAASKGVVLECRDRIDHGVWVTSCLVMMPGGNTGNLAYGRCPSN